LPARECARPQPAAGGPAERPIQVMIMNANQKLIVALDVDRFEEARELIDVLKDDVETFKVGSQIFTACGPVIVRYLQALGKKVFLDLKYHDIPNTVGNAVQSAVQLNVPVHEVLGQSPTNPTENSGISLCSVHTAGGAEMLKAAASKSQQQADILKVTRPLIIGITILTSEENRDNIQQIVLERAKLAKDSGLDGVVASSQESSFIRKEFGEDFIIVTPGIRPSGSQRHDQKRIATPREAIENGSTYLVVGRPIVKAENPKEAAVKILNEIDEASINNQ